MSPTPEKNVVQYDSLLFTSEEWRSIQNSPFDLRKYIIAERRAKIFGFPFVPPEGHDWDEYIAEVLNKLNATLHWPEQK